MSQLEGIRIVSLAEQYPGPYATLLMADLGADVILVERPGMGDPARQFPAFHAALNRNKRSVALDLKAEEDKQRFRELVASADVLLEGFRPGTMQRLGLGFEAMAAINPGLVYASISGFGQTGPYRDRPAHDLSYQALAGSSTPRPQRVRRSFQATLRSATFHPACLQRSACWRRCWRGRGPEREPISTCR